jgi:hypothetical protein
MQLRAMHIDGFSEHLLCWELFASRGTAIVEASWQPGDRHSRIEHVFEIDFPDTRIQECAAVLAKLKPVYDGQTSDMPQYSLSVEVGDNRFSTTVRAAASWPDEDKSAVDSFMQFWRPLSREVETLLAIPGRNKRRK